MSDFPCVSGEEAIRAFSKVGFALVRIRGSHHILKRPGYRYVLSVPVHRTAALKRRTLRSLIRTAGLTVDEFVALLG